MLDKKKLKQLEARFLARYPKGFADPEMEKIKKKHNGNKMSEMAQATFAKAKFKQPAAIVEDMMKIIGRSSMISMFEKPKFKDFVNTLSSDEKAFLANALKQQLHGNQRAGFEAMLSMLQTAKLAKWSLISIIPAYYAPTAEVFVKPTTAKNILNYFEITESIYKPTPYWEFYESYRALINEAKTKVHKSLSPSNAAFSGFLMMTVKE